MGFRDICSDQTDWKYEGEGKFDDLPNTNARARIAVAKGMQCGLPGHGVPSRPRMAPTAAERDLGHAERRRRGGVLGIMEGA
jgi:hypothetical protein